VTRSVQHPTGWLAPKFDRELTGWRRIVTGRRYFAKSTTAAEGSDPSATTDTTP
jgi:hypothetical protein